MNFFIPRKIIFNLDNISTSCIEDYINREFEITTIKKYHEYEINFSGFSSNDSDFKLEVNQYFDDNTRHTEVIKLNQSMICSNYYLDKISLSILKKGNLNLQSINLEVIESPISFNNTSLPISEKLSNFINYIDIEKNLYHEKTVTYSINIASILDEFSFDCFKEDINILNLCYDNYYQELENFNPDILFVESAWSGINQSWKNKIANKDSTVDSNLLDIIDYCNARKIPTVFWNKEGLINFESFKTSSSIFDYIFVTDENMIQNQIEVCNHSNVYILPFAAQPKIHNSINKNKYHLGDIAFAGAWYGDKHLTRLNDIDIILKPSLDFNVDIFDRNYNNRSYLEYLNLYWPKEFFNNIIGSLNYDALVYAYKNYDLFLNINSVQDSIHMLSRRVYEILASKTPVLSSPSKSIDYYFSDYIYISSSSDQTRLIIKNILSNNLEVRKKSKKAQRYILEQHTYKNRLEYLFDIVGVTYNKITSPSVCILSFIEDISSIDNLYKNVSSQNYQSDLHLILHPSLDIPKNSIICNFDNITIHSCDFYNSICLQNLIDIILSKYPSYDYFAIFNPNSYYGDNYIRDYINTLSFVTADVLGKNNIYTKLDVNGQLILEHCDKSIDSYCDKIYFDTAFIKNISLKSILNKINPTQHLLINSNPSLILYSDDEFNFSYSPSISSYVSV